jgi:hypothetical protein
MSEKHRTKPVDLDGETIVQRCPWQTDFMVAIKRVLIVAFPASMSAAISDTLK